MNREDKARIFMWIGIMLFILSILFDYGLRTKMIELDNWKQTYENGYCPTCGALLKEQNNG